MHSRSFDERTKGKTSSFWVEEQPEDHNFDEEKADDCGGLEVVISADVAHFRGDAAEVQFFWGVEVPLATETAVLADTVNDLQTRLFCLELFDAFRETI